MSGAFDFDKFKSNLSKLPSIPGTKSVTGSEFWYFEAASSANNVEQFRLFLAFDTALRAETGGVSLLNCEIKPPDTCRFLAIGLRGDIPGWRNKIEEAANGLNLKTAKIEDDKFIIAGDRNQTFLLKNCQIRFFRPEDSKKGKPKYREDIVVKQGEVYKAE